MAETGEAKLAEGYINEESIAKMRSLIGTKFRIADSIYNEEATKLAIEKFADGIGDPNPLWRDLEYAKKTKYGTIPAPPSFVWGVFSSVQFGWRGLGGFHNATDLYFYKPVLLGDKVTPESIYRGFDGPKESQFAERMVIDHVDDDYYNQRQELVAQIKWNVIRYERAKAREKGKYSGTQIPHPWTEAELVRIEDEVLAEEIRGSELRYWEDVNVGDEMTPVVKGPLGLTDIIAFICGGGPPIPRVTAHGVQLSKYRKHPAWAFRDPNTHALEPVFAVHYNQAAAKQQGLPYPYDVGVQRHCWQMESLTDWMGDDGWLKRSYAEYRGFVYLSDVVWLKGKVTKKYFDENDEPCVDIETSGTNQRGDNVMPGMGTVILPSREKGTFPLDRRLK
jgi:acyl dehydratase